MKWQLWSLIAATALVASGITYYARLDTSIAATPAVPASAAAPGTPAPVDINSTIFQRDGDSLRLLNTVIHLPERAEARHVDVVLTFAVNKDGQVEVASVKTQPTTVVGVDALVAGDYTYNKEVIELKGPALDVDMRPTWTISNKNFYGAVVSGPIKVNPQIGTLKGTDALPEAGAYGLVFHDLAFPGFQNSPKTLVNLRQVGDTIVVTGYALNGKAFEQTGSAVLKKK
jgi:hypothetical protein